MSKTIINTPDAPAAIGPYVQATRVGNFLFTSGQIPLDPKSNTLVTGDIKVQAHQSCKNPKPEVNYSVVRKKGEKYGA